MIIYGRNAVAEYLKGGGTVDKLFVAKGVKTAQEIIELARNAGVPVSFCERVVLDRMADGNHQGIVASVSEFVYSEFDTVASKSFIVILDGVQDPHNLGAILRVCECAGVGGVIIGKNRCAQVTDTVIKVACGAAAEVPVARVTNVNDAIRKLKDSGMPVYCLETGGQSIYDSRLTGSLALVVGGEGTGVHELTRKLCDQTLSLPLNGKLNSLNASVAAGIAIYEKVRQDKVIPTK